MTTILLCLHGWGGTKESFTELRAALKGTDMEILTPDLPGFGEEPDPPKPWSVNEYADWVEQWLSSSVRSPLSEILLLGHSHGGRIAITLASRGKLPIAHLYLCASAGIRRPRHLKRLLGLFLAKTGTFVLTLGGLNHLQPLGKKLLYRLVHVHDYEKASPVMRQTLIRVTAQDLRPMLAGVHVQTDIFWGTADRTTPMKDGILMHHQIPGSTLHTFPGVRHAVHRERAAALAAIIKMHL